MRGAARRAAREERKVPAKVRNARQRAWQIGGGEQALQNLGCRDPGRRNGIRAVERKDRRGRQRTHGSAGQPCAKRSVVTPRALSASQVAEHSTTCKGYLSKM